MKKVNKAVFCTLLTLAGTVTAATNYTMVAIDENGNAVNSCGTKEIVTPIYYYDSSCTLALDVNSGGSDVEIQLGPCPSANHKLKIIIDNHMYKFNVDGYFYKDLIGEDDVLSVAASIAGCSDSGPASELQLFTETDLLNLDANFGIHWAEDSNGKPVVVVKSVSGNVVCNNGISVTVNDGDNIFAHGFE